MSAAAPVAAPSAPTLPADPSAPAVSPAIANPATMPTFANTGTLLYNVGPWNIYGFGVPNFGNCPGTLSTGIAHLVDSIGKAQLTLMTMIDASRWQPPSFNAVYLLCTMYNRAASVMSLRAKAIGNRLLSPGKVGQSPKPFLIHPVPYFQGPLVVNPWLFEYNELLMVALGNMMQHTSNGVALNITAQFAAEIMPYFQDIATKIGTELITLPAGRDPTQPGFLFQLDPTGQTGDLTSATYHPDTQTINEENISQTPPLYSMPSYADMAQLAQGIPAVLIAPNLTQYPVALPQPQSGLSGSLLSASQALMAAAAQGPSNLQGSSVNTPNAAAAGQPGGDDWGPSSRRCRANERIAGPGSDNAAARHRRHELKFRCSPLSLEGIFACPSSPHRRRPRLPRPPPLPPPRRRLPPSRSSSPMRCPPPTRRTSPTPPRSRRPKPMRRRPRLLPRLRPRMSRRSRPSNSRTA